MRIENIILDPSGYVVLLFKSDNDRVDFLNGIKDSELFGKSIPSRDTVLSWKLSELSQVKTIWLTPKSEQPK